MREILELDVRMTDGSHHLIDLKEQSVKFSLEDYTQVGVLEPLDLILGFLTKYQYRSDCYIDVTGIFSKSTHKSKWEREEDEDTVYDHDGFSRIFCNKVTYIMVVYKKDDEG